LIISFKNYIYILNPNYIKLFYMSYQSKLKECPICYKEVFARGLVGHLRLSHGINLKKITQVVKLTSQDSSHLRQNSSTANKSVSDSSHNTKYEIGELVNSQKDEIVIDSKSFAKPVEKTLWGTYPSGTESCTGCRRHFWTVDMIPGFYAPQCKYCIMCYKRLN